MDTIVVQPVQTNVLDYILATLKDLKRDITFVKEKLETAPAYGSDEWWEWSIKKSEEDFEAGRYTVVRNQKELKEFLANL